MGLKTRWGSKFSQWLKSRFETFAFLILESWILGPSWVTGFSSSVHHTGQCHGHAFWPGARLPTCKSQFCLLTDYIT